METGTRTWYFQMKGYGNCSSCWVGMIVVSGDVQGIFPDVPDGTGVRSASANAVEDRVNIGNGKMGIKRLCFKFFIVLLLIIIIASLIFAALFVQKKSNTNEKIADMESKQPNASGYDEQLWKASNNGAKGFENSDDSVSRMPFCCQSVKEELSARGWKNITVTEGYQCEWSDTVDMTDGMDVSELYTVTGRTDGMLDNPIFVVVVLHANNKRNIELGRIVNYISSSGRDYLSRDKLTFDRQPDRIFNADDEELWDFMYSY